MQGYGNTPAGVVQRRTCGRVATSRVAGSVPLPALGIHGRSASPLGTETAKDGLVARYARQVAARELLPRRKALQGCSRWLRSCGQTVQLLHAPELQVGLLGGLQHCGSVWQCPVCSAKISERRREELGVALATWRQAFDGVAVLVTYTVRHQYADDLQATLEGLLAARRGLLSGKALQAFNSRYAVSGRIRALEVTWGRNGWHPHIHELMFLTAVPDENAMVAQLRERWGRQVERVGLASVNAHSVDVRLGDLSAGDYVAKFGRERTWHVENELTKAAAKNGRVGSLSPLGLLDSAMWGDERSAHRWREYALTFQGRRQLHWSHGLRGLLGLDPEKTDEQLVEEQKETALLLDELQRQEWAVVLGNDARAELLRVLGVGCVKELRNFLSVLGIERPPVVA